MAWPGRRWLSASLVLTRSAQRQNGKAPTPRPATSFHSGHAGPALAAVRPRGRAGPEHWQALSTPSPPRQAGFACRCLCVSGDPSQNPQQQCYQQDLASGGLSSTFPQRPTHLAGFSAGWPQPGSYFCFGGTARVDRVVASFSFAGHGCQVTGGAWGATVIGLALDSSMRRSLSSSALPRIRT